MAGVCTACKKEADLTNCFSCSSRVCYRCFGKNGCKSCVGRLLKK